MEVRVRAGHALSYAGLDELADVVPDEVFLRAVEVAVDVAEGGQVEDDRLHLIFGDAGVGGELKHEEEGTPLCYESATRSRRRRGGGRGCVFNPRGGQRQP